MFGLTHDLTGSIHLIASIVAIATGTLVLSLTKGTRRHKQMGYTYAGCMVIVVITSFMMYHLFGGFGIFHFAALVSGVTLAGGMTPILRKKPKNYVLYHFIWMYWSVMGLYAALASEILPRVAKTYSEDPPFLLLVGIATFFIMGIASVFFRRKLPAWKSEFVQN